MAPKNPGERPSEPNAQSQLLAAANAGAAVVRPLFTTYLLFILYVVVIVATTTDEDLLKGTTVKLPLLDAHIPLVGFYVTAPLLLVVLHLWLLLHFSLICENAHSLMRIAQHLPEAKYSLLRQRLDNFTLLHAITHEKPGAFRTLLLVINGLVLAAFPIVGLLVIQGRFIAYHDVVITWWHRVLVLTDIAMVSYFWPVVIQGREHGMWEWAKRTAYTVFLGWNLAIVAGFARLVRGVASHVPPGWEGFSAFTRFVLIAIPAVVSAFLLCFPREGIDIVAYHKVLDAEAATHLEMSRPQLWFRERLVFLSNDRPVFAQESHTVLFLPFVRRNLWAPNAILVKGRVEPGVIENLRRSDPVALASIEPLDLSLRDLNYATLTGVLMPRANLNGAQLMHSAFQQAHLEGATFRNANLAGVTFEQTSLLAADFSSANLDGALFLGADMRAASLRNASAELTRWVSVNAIGAVLAGANLSGARLQVVDLRGAVISEGWQLRRPRLPTLSASHFLSVKLPALASGELREIDVNGAVFENSETVAHTVESANETDPESPVSRPLSDYKSVLPLAADTLASLRGKPTTAAPTRVLNRDRFCRARTKRDCPESTIPDDAMRMLQLASMGCRITTEVAWGNLIDEIGVYIDKGAGEEQLKTAVRSAVKELLQACMPASIVERDVTSRARATVFEILPISEIVRHAQAPARLMYYRALHARAEETGR